MENKKPEIGKAEALIEAIAAIKDEADRRMVIAVATAFADGFMEGKKQAKGAA